MKTLTALEARKWMIENPGMELIDGVGMRWKWSAEQYSHVLYFNSDRSWGIALPRSNATFTLPQPELRFLKDIRELEGVEQVRYVRPSWLYSTGERTVNRESGWGVLFVAEIQTLLSLGVQIEVVK